MSKITIIGCQFLDCQNLTFVCDEKQTLASYCLLHTGSYPEPLNTEIKFNSFSDISAQGESFISPNMPYRGQSSRTSSQSTSPSYSPNGSVRRLRNEGVGGISPGTGIRKLNTVESANDSQSIENIIQMLSDIENVKQK